MINNLNIKWFPTFDPSQDIKSINDATYPQGTTGITLAANNPQWDIYLDLDTGIKTLYTITTGIGELTLIDTDEVDHVSTNPDPIVIGSCILIGGRKPHHP